jgi:trimeric autotransporter adhesin
VLPYNTTGYNNTAIGWEALVSNTAGSHNTAIGQRAGLNVVTAANVICIGAPGANVSDSCYIGNVWQQPGGSQAVYVNSEGKLGTQVSSRRFKDEIKPINQASEAIHRLRPVSFRYKAEVEPTRPVSFGLIAEEVEKINADLVTRDKAGKPLSVRYDAVNAMLLNEFLKEHRKVEDQDRRILKQEATIDKQQKEIEALTAGLQKVSAQLELGKTAPQTVLNNQ